MVTRFNIRLYFISIVALFFAPPSFSEKIKNVILVIGDGMGPQQIGLLEAYAKRAPNSIYNGKNTTWRTFAQEGKLGLVMTDAHESLVTDSACAATQLATGVDSRNGMIGLGVDGKPAASILEKAKKLGKATALISDTRITHATPAAFASHVPYRDDENTIAEQMLRGGMVDILLSGGLRHFIPEADEQGAQQKKLRKLINNPAISMNSVRADQVNLLEEARASGYALAFDWPQLKKNKSKKVVGLFASSALYDGIEHKRNKADPVRTQPTLSDMTGKALTLLAQEPKGFFLMVEAGQIDWASHSNDAATLLHEMIKMDEMLAVIYGWVKDREDTMVIITADHETGGFGFHYGRHKLPKPVAIDSPAFADAPYQARYNFGSLDILDKLYSQQLSHWKILEKAQDSAGIVSVAALKAIYNQHSEFSLSEREAHVVASVNEKSFDEKRGSFYQNITGVRLGLLARELAHQQNVLWASGTHTHTPVPYIVWGPAGMAKRFANASTHVEINKQMSFVMGAGG